MTIYGTCYKPGSIVIKRMTGDSPEFWRLVDIVMDDVGGFFFVLQLLSQPEIFPHFHAYFVNKTLSKQMCICEQEDLCDYHSYYLHHSFNSDLRNIQFVVPKYHTIDLN